MRLAWVSIVVLAAACGASPEAPAKAPATTVGPQSAGEECLAAASAPRSAGEDAPESIEVSHILVRHRDLPRNREDRSREQACLRALQALEKLKAGSDFDSVVAEYSDEKGASDRGGSLGRVTPDELNPAFAAAAFELAVDELSYVVESKSGFHIILRTD